MNEFLRPVGKQSHGDCAPFTGEDFFIASIEPRGLSARCLSDLATVVAGSIAKSDERPSK